ncbi:MAG: carbamoyltransferase HypF, partial [Bacteroidota bacterium]|nr:carbamoyltransferase HypF [Bacteroidota bacterium]
MIIHLTGNPDAIQSFYDALIKNPPVASKILEHDIGPSNFTAFKEFTISPSQKSGKLNLQLTPDFAICDDCKTEITDKHNRRYHYPFTTCVNCGPRWAITNTFPFERDHTHMVSFPMCETCSNEYGTPTDRRFHSQTNTCPECGIQLRMSTSDGTIINADYLIEKTADLIKEGNILAIKNTSGYLLCCDANNAEAIKKLRERKNRPTKPFAILYPSLHLLKQHLKINSVQEETLTSPESPIVIIQKKDFKGQLALEELAPRLNQLGVMLPYSGILHLLATELEIPIVATSGNIHASPIISYENTAHSELCEVADYFLDHNLKIANPQDDSVLKFSNRYSEKIIFRRSRGLSPNFDAVVKTDKKIIAMGGHLKSTVAFFPNDYLYISQYLGNLDHFDVFERYTQTVQKFIDLFEETPEVVLVDKHQGYNSTRHGLEIARELHLEIHQIQHHKAHFASVLGEHGLFNGNSRILGVVWDGTGYGDDSQIWGGEFFVYQKGKIARTGHFDYYDWLAGDKMAKEPRLSFFSLATSTMKEEIKQKFTDEEIAVYNHLKKKETLKTSSVGRLFDAVASLLNLCDHNTYEGEAAILMENKIDGYDLSKCKSYAPEIINGNVSTKELFQNLYSDFSNGAEKCDVIINFLYTLANIIIKSAQHANVKEIALSGGVFQNTILVDMIKELSGSEYKLYFNRNLSPNDENISFGQLMYHL